jgi:DivIVA domain-containing protein
VTVPATHPPDGPAVPVFPPARRSARGYDEHEVDAFVARLAPVLAGVPGVLPVTARQVRTALFRRVPVGRRGYDAGAVDVYLLRAAAILGAREGRAGAPVPPADPRALQAVLAEFRPKKTRLGRGYLPEEVDAFLGRLDRALAAGEPLGPDVAAGASFRLVVGGYDTSGVDDLLDRLEGLLTARSPR